MEIFELSGSLEIMFIHYCKRGDDREDGGEEEAGAAARVFCSKNVGIEMTPPYHCGTVTCNMTFRGLVNYLSVAQFLAQKYFLNSP